MAPPYGVSIHTALSSSSVKHKHLFSQQSHTRARQSPSWRHPEPPTHHLTHRRRRRRPKQSKPFRTQCRYSPAARIRLISYISHTPPHAVPNTFLRYALCNYLDSPRTHTTRLSAKITSIFRITKNHINLTAPFVIRISQVKNPSLSLSLCAIFSIVITPFSSSPICHSSIANFSSLANSDFASFTGFSAFSAAPSFSSPC
ncbi:uncharacterized protein RJT20DRAFT_44709 [Scheffersomyces xylosifermentans]|uniref:uncharacterized protein n=1 Tax=Scheffersomyces xylosifermentans TaxID=1304137 RepID=UPI00315D8DB5